MYLPNWDTLETKVKFTTQDTGIAGVNWDYPRQRGMYLVTLLLGKKNTCFSEWQLFDCFKETLLYYKCWKLIKTQDLENG